MTKKKRAEDRNSTKDVRYKNLAMSLKRNRRQQDALIEVLHTAQEAFGYLDKEVLLYVARELRLPPSWVFGVATFYHFFSLEPRGEHSCTVCTGTACYVKGADKIVADLEEAFGTKMGETTPDNKLSLAAARCLGSCGMAPLVLVDGEAVAKAEPEELISHLRKVMDDAAEEQEEQNKNIDGEAKV